LLFGWLGNGAWYANPLLLLTWILLLIPNGGRKALYFAAGSLALSLSFLFQRRIIGDAAGHEFAITRYAAEYWIWLASTGTALAACFVDRLFPNRAARDKDDSALAPHDSDEDDVYRV
jgi:hypothetical protein